MALRIEKQQVLTLTPLIILKYCSLSFFFGLVSLLTIDGKNLQENARKIAMYLSSHPRVKKVYYAGLPDHPGHHLHFSQVLKSVN